MQVNTYPGHDSRDISQQPKPPPAPALQSDFDNLLNMDIGASNSLNNNNNDNISNNNNNAPVPSAIPGSRSIDNGPYLGSKLDSPGSCHGVVSHQNNNCTKPSLLDIPTQSEKFNVDMENRLNLSNPHPALIETAHKFYQTKEFCDLHIHCEDGVIAAHRLVLAIASPFLRALISAESSHEASSNQPVILVLPDVKLNLVQALLEFLYTGRVTMQEVHFYSLMKLVYDLNINASIGAEKTKDPPTNFNSQPIVSQKPGSSMCVENLTGYGEEKRPRKRARTDTFDTLSALLEESASHQQAGKQDSYSAQLYPKAGDDIMENGLEASNVVVKQETEESPGGQLQFTRRNSYDRVGVTSLSTNSANNNPLNSFVSINANHQVEILSPVNLSDQLNLVGNPLLTPLANQQPQNATCQQKETISTRTTRSDDPLAAIMNQTIFGGDNMNPLFLQVKSTAPTFQTTCPPTISATLSNNILSTSSLHHHSSTEISFSGRSISDLIKVEECDSHRAASGGGDEPTDNLGSVVGQAGVSQDVATADEGNGGDEEADSVNSYSCHLCHRVFKGKVLLQAHQYQEHHENPEFDASNLRDNKFACRVCLKTFTRNSDVKAHILRVHCGDRKYPCTICGKRFKESTHLRKHLYTHTGERPHYCSYCNKGFQTSSDLKRHKKTRVHQEKVDQASSLQSREVGVSDNQGDKESADDPSAYNRWQSVDDEELEGGSVHSTSNASNRPGSSASAQAGPHTPSSPYESLASACSTPLGRDQPSVLTTFPMSTAGGNSTLVDSVLSQLSLLNPIPRSEASIHQQQMRGSTSLVITSMPNIMQLSGTPSITISGLQSVGASANIESSAANRDNGNSIPLDINRGTVGNLSSTLMDKNMWPLQGFNLGGPDISSNSRSGETIFTIKSNTGVEPSSGPSHSKNQLDVMHDLSVSTSSPLADVFTSLQNAHSLDTTLGGQGVNINSGDIDRDALGGGDVCLSETGFLVTGPISSSCSATSMASASTSAACSTTSFSPSNQSLVAVSQANLSLACPPFSASSHSLSPAGEGGSGLDLQNLSLQSSTLDLSDIKWGILDPVAMVVEDPATAVKQPASQRTINPREDL